jgi:hypothetical protein
MKRFGFLTFSLLLPFAVGAPLAAPVDPVNYHFSFEDMKFLDGDFVARSGLKTASDRGLMLAEGRFGKGITTTVEPSQLDIDNMSGVDLDLITAVIFNTLYMRDSTVGYNEPILWGTGKVNPSSGALAFWVKGKLREGALFEQTACAWGRKERDLISLNVRADGSLSASLSDARYRKHEIVSTFAPGDSGWYHIALNWDRAEGLELFVNGKSVASSWGSDSWWETALPGLLHFPMPKVTYDEAYFFGRPLNAAEIAALIKTNTPPAPAASIPERPAASRDRLARAMGVSTRSLIPVLTPWSGGKTLVFRAVEPEYLGDGAIRNDFCHDGRYELALPHPIGIFTIIPGDEDFTAEKLDLDPPAGIPFNYVTVEGNLTGAEMYTDCVRSGDSFTGKTLVAASDSVAFFHGEMIDRAARGRITIPFLKGYGAPPGFSGPVHLPLTGDIRVHEVDLFDASPADVTPVPGETACFLSREGEPDGRYAFGLSALDPAADREVLIGFETPDGKPARTFDTGLLRRTHIMTAPSIGAQCIGGLLLDMPLKTAGDDVLLLRLHDPASLSRIWTHAEIKLKGFESEGRLRVLLEFAPMILAEGDRVWLDLATLNGAKIRIGAPDGARIVLRPAPYLESIARYEKKTLTPAFAEYSRMFGYVPWKFDRTSPDFLAPQVLGGPFDIIYSAQAVKRAFPRSFLADFYIEFSKPSIAWGNPADPKKDIELKSFDIPAGIPRWAWLQKRVQDFRYRILDWDGMNQNPDGQWGGGWNDDNDMLVGKLDMFLDGSTLARTMQERMYAGLDAAGYIQDGYCRIVPMDRLHVDDMLHDRFRELIYYPGDPARFRRALRTAWRWDKPQETPVNWGTGKSFLYDKGILEWYWGKSIPQTAFTFADTADVNSRLLRFASFCDDLAFYEFTDARVYTDQQFIYDENLITSMIIGGSADSTVSAEWTEGGGKALARWVTRADSSSFECRMFSFDPLQRKTTLRLFRIKQGTYEVKLAEDLDGVAGRVLYTGDMPLRRFDTASVLVPPGKPVLLSVRMVKPENPAGPPPDLAIAGYDCIRGKNTLWVRVSNLGGGPSGKTAIRLYDSTDRQLGEQSLPEIPPPTDFVEKSVWVTFENVPETGTLRLVVDPQGKIKEIYKGNNEAVVE